MEQAVGYAQELIDATMSRPERLLHDSSSSSTSKWKTIHQRLLDLYLEESKKEPKCSELKCTSHLLDKLVQREHLNTLAINLYPSNEGYSLMLKGRTGADSETIRLPYEESQLLDYLDAEQLPPLLVELLDKVQANIFYCGCVIAEIRDYRRTVNNLYDTMYVLLKPTPQTLLSDINAMTSNNYRWSQEDKLTLESQLLLRINEPLCLDPSPAVGIIANMLTYQKHKFNHQALKRAMKKYSQATINKRQKLSQCPAPKHLKLHDFLARKKEKLKASPTVNLKVGKTCVDMWRQRDVHLLPPESIDVDKYAKVLEKPKQLNGNTPVVIEEYTFETERSHGKVYYSRLTILQRLNEEFYLGQLYVDRDYIEGQSQGSTCKFSLGTKSNVEKYIRQFREIFTEEGRRQVKITHQVPGHCPTVTFTQTFRSLASTATTQPTTPATQTTSIITQATNLAATITGQLGLVSPSADSSSKKSTPIRLSLSLNPQLAVSGGSVASTQGGGTTPVTAQLTLSLPQQQQLAAAQRMRQVNIFQGLQRNASGSVTTPTTTTTIQLSPSVKVGKQQSVITLDTTPTPTPTHTPPLTTPGQQGALAGASGLRGNSLSSQPLHLNISGNLVHALSGRHPQASPVTPSTPTGTDQGTAVENVQTGFISIDSLTNQHKSSNVTQTTPSPNMNIANLSTAPPNINIQNIAGLPGVNLAANLQGLQNLQNVQVSLGNVNLPSDLTIPVPITQTGILVGSLPSAIQAMNTTTVTAGSAGGVSSTSLGSLTSPTYVTMVTATSGMTTGITSTSNTTVLSNPSTGMLSVPIGVAGNLTQIMAGLKGAQGLRPGTPVLLSQIPGQPGQQIQLLSATGLGQTRAQGSSIMSIGSQHSTSSKLGSTTASSASLAAQPTAQLPQIRTSSGGQTQMLTAQQLVQLTTSQQQQLSQLALQQQKLQPQQKIALQHLQQQQKLTPQQIQQLQHILSPQLQQLPRQQQQGAVLATVTTAAVNPSSKPKSKKKSGSSPKSS